MRLQHIVIMCIVFVCVFSGFCIPGHGIDAIPVGVDDEYEGSVADTAVADTIWMRADTVTTCILKPDVLLTCDEKYKDEDILEYKWIDLTTNKVIGTTRSIWVKVTNTKEYSLEIQLLDIKKELIYNGDFERGNVGFSSAYLAMAEGKNALYNDGRYVISYDPSKNHPSAFYSIGDHTSGKGRMMIINGNTGRNVKVWGQRITGLEPKKQYAFSAWAVQVSYGAQPILQYMINGKPLSTSNSDNCTPPFMRWVRFHKYWTAGDEGVADISLVDQCSVGGGNDFAIDDISFAPISLIKGKVVVKVRPQIDMDALEDVEVCEGTDLMIVPHVNGSDIKGYKWLRLSDNVEVGQTKDLTIRNASLSKDQGQYLCVVNGICGADSAIFTIDVREKLKVSGPETDTVEACLRSGAVLSAARCSGYNLSYEWRAPANNWAKPGKNWLPVTANQVSYSKSSVDNSDAGKYRCIVKSNSRNIGYCGIDTVYSLLVVKNMPVLVSKSADTTICTGEDLNLFVSTDAKDAATKWFLPDGSFADGSNITVKGGESAGIYKYAVDNGCGSLTGFVFVGVFEPMGELRISNDTIVCRGGLVTLKAKVSGTNLKYEWNGPGGFRAFTPTVVIADVTEVKEGEYHLSVTDTCGSVQTGVVKVSMYREFDNLTINADKMYCRGDKGDTLQVKGGGSGLKYIWTCPDGSVVQKSKIVLPAIGYDNIGVYVCQVNGVCGNMKRSTEVGMYGQLEINGNTGLSRLCEGESVRLEANSNLPVLRYEWKKDGQVLNEASGQLMLGNIGKPEVGKYECNVVAVCGSKKLNYEIQLKESTKITDYTPDVYVNESGSARLFVNAIGENNVYEWVEKGVSTGVNSNKLFINNVGLAGERVFICKVKGSCGEAEQAIHIYIGKYHVLTKDEAVRLCEGGDYAYNAGLLPAGCELGASLSYRWERNGQVVKNTSVIDFKGLKADEGGRYTCYINGACGQAVLNLDVLVVKSPKLSGVPDKLQVCEMSGFAIRARVNSNDFVTYTWQKNNVQVGGTDSIFRIKEALLTDIGKYTCRVTGQCGEDSKGFLVDVRKKLKILESQDSVKACNGMPVGIEIVAVGDSVKYTWNGPGKSGWTGENTPVYKNEAIAGGKDEGKYWCVVNSQCGTDTVFTIVDIEKELKLLEKSPDDTVCPLTKVDLYARVNLENVKYTWKLPDGTLIKSKDISIESMKSSDAGIYHYQIEGRCSDVSGNISLALHKAMGELKLSRDTAVCESDTVRFAAMVEGDGISYQWRGPGRFKSTDALIVINGVVAASTGEYNIVVSDVCNQQKQGRVNLSLLNEFKDIQITGDTSLCPGTKFVAEVKGGSADLSYEWTHGNRIVGNNPQFSIEHVSQADTGEYVCRITGTCLTQERKVRLEVYKSLTLGEMIEEVRVCEGTDTSFLMVADGEQVKYIWSKSGDEAGTREALLPLYEVTTLDTGVYLCHVTSACGEEEKSFHIQIKPKTVIKSHTPDRFVTENDPTLLFVRTEGENNKYKWWCDGVEIGDNSEMLFVPDVGKADTLYFVCAVEGDCGVDSVHISIKIGEFKSIKETASPDTLCEGSTYTYVADVIPDDCFGDETFEYTWSFKGMKVAEGPLLRLEELKLEHAGEYTCLIKSECGEAKVTWDIHVIALPVIQQITADAFVIEGSSHKIEVEATGDGVSYSWTKDGNNFPGKGTELVFQPVSYEDRGVYKVSVKNVCTSVTEESELRVWQKTTIVVPLVSDAVMCQGQDSVFRVEALGSNGLLYKWYHNGVLLSCPMIAELTLNKVTKKNAGEYMCVVSGKGGNDTCFMNLAVNELPEAEIAGLLAMCMNDLTQHYECVSVENSLVYSWTAQGGALKGQHLKNIDITWQGIDKSRIILQVTSAITGCRREVEKEIEFKQLPEIYLDLPEMVGYCIDSLILNQGYPFGGQYWVNNIPASSVIFDYKEHDHQVSYSYKEEETGCVNTIEQQIGVDEEPVITLKDERVETGLCKPVVLSLSKVSRGDIKWSDEKKLDLSDVLNPVYTPKAEDNENVYFSVELTDKYKCRASDFEIISIIPLPTVKAMNDFKAGVCGETILTAEYNTSRFDRIEWQPSDQLINRGDYTAGVVEKIAGQHIYRAVVTDIYGCQGSDSVTLTVMPSPPVDDKEFCENIPFYVSCFGYLDYVWSDGYPEQTRILDKGGDYSLVITDEFGCVGTVYYTVHPMPVVDLRDTVLFTGQTSEFILNLEERYGPYDIIWQDNSGGNSYLVEKEGHYSVKVTDNLGCMSQDTAYVEMKKRYIAAPDAFLPGTNNENSRFYLKEVNFVDRFEMFIYDRWGQLIFKTTKIGYEGGWDGNFKGVECQPGAYVWVAFANGKEVGRGTLMLIK